MRVLFVLGRTLFGGFCTYSGIKHLQSARRMGQHAGVKGVPAAGRVVNATTGLMLIAGGVSVMAGLRPRQGLAAIVTFLVPATLQMQRFWDEAHPMSRQSKRVQFMKNVAVVGAALVLIQSEAPWPASFDEARHADEEMFIRLGGREMRSLPV